jgi:6-phosphogluconolactonase
MAGNDFLVFIGAYTRRDGLGIGVARFNSESGALTTPELAAEITNASFVALDPTLSHLYAVTEIDDYDGNISGALSSFSVDRSSGNLNFLNRQPTNGPGPCYVNVDATGRNAVVANYNGGSVAVLPINADGSLEAPSDFVQHEGETGPNSDRQDGPHAHSANLDHETGRVYINDLGLDRIKSYELDSATGKLTPADLDVELHPGAGPRHFDFHPDGAHAYAINELDSTITAMDYDRTAGRLTPTQTVSALPEGWSGSTTTADLHISPDGRFIYGSNRGHDSIVIYAIDANSGQLAYVGHESTRGRNPRNFAIDPSGRYLLAANQDSDNIVVFERDIKSGKLATTGTEVSVSMPVCLKLVPTA